MAAADRMHSFSRRRSRLMLLPVMAIVVLLTILVRPSALITYTLLALAGGMSNFQSRP
ncbi:hypothetical protein [Synechococcus sp. MIT S1220]|uniref:hypothetical protein n=1 Tax=Synechococcus sp. MIT S1220 TaxID=3082549 RepID=UPI0039B1258B